MNLVSKIWVYILLPFAIAALIRVIFYPGDMVGVVAVGVSNIILCWIGRVIFSKYNWYPFNNKNNSKLV